MGYFRCRLVLEPGARLDGSVVERTARRTLDRHTLDLAGIDADDENGVAISALPSQSGVGSLDTWGFGRSYDGPALSLFLCDAGELHVGHGEMIEHLSCGVKG